MLLISDRTAMKLFDAYKKQGKLTTHQPGLGGIKAFWTQNLAFKKEENGYNVSVKKGSSQSALQELIAYLGGK